MDIDRIYITHFGSFENPKRIFSELIDTLQDYAAFMKPFVVANRPIEEISPLFQKFVSERMRKAGLTDKEAYQYETANPAYMSVAGLIRYWNKKLTMV